MSNQVTVKNIQHIGVMRYNNPTPNPLPASDEGAMMYLIYLQSAVTKVVFLFPVAGNF